MVAVAAVPLTAAGASAATPRNLKAGQRVIFPVGTLKVGSTVACTSHAIRIVARVQRRGRSVTRIADGLRGSATIDLTTRANGSVVAFCR